MYTEVLSSQLMINDVAAIIWSTILMYLPVSCPPKSKVLNLILPIINSSWSEYTKIELRVQGEITVTWRNLARLRGEVDQRINRYSHLLGWSVGVLIVTLPSLRTCSSVVFPALSKPRNKIFALLWYKPTSEKWKTHQFLIDTGSIAHVNSPECSSVVLPNDARTLYHQSKRNILCYRRWRKLVRLSNALMNNHSRRQGISISSSYGAIFSIHWLASLFLNEADIEIGSKVERIEKIKDKNL